MTKDTPLPPPVGINAAVCTALFSRTSFVWVSDSGAGTARRRHARATMDQKGLSQPASGRWYSVVPTMRPFPPPTIP